MSKVEKIYKPAEFSVLFIGVPVLFYFEWIPVPKIAALLAVAIVVLMILWSDPSYNFKSLMYKPGGKSIFKKLLWKSGLVALVLVLMVLFLRPEALLSLPGEEPMIWGIILVLYPVLSALPQELVYREFFFQRYKGLFGEGWSLGAMSAISFCFLHIIYDNPWAMILSLAGGFMFAGTYRKTRSLYWVSLEHAIYGCLIFTIGMGNYFYEGF